MLNEYVVLDLETTGLSKNYHRITEIAAVRVKKGKVIDEFQTLVNPCVPIPRFITRLTGITNEMVEDSPTIGKALPLFLKFLGNGVIVAHNATFDHGFIFENAKKHLNVEIKNERLCTKKLANRLVPELSSKRLSALCEHFEIDNEQAHRAMSDVKATAELFSYFVDMMGDTGLKTKKDIFSFEKTPRKKINNS